MLYTSEYRFKLLQWMFNLAVLLFKPFWVCAIHLASLIEATTEERKMPLQLFWKRFKLISPLFIACITFSPFAVIGFLLRCVLLYFKRPYRLSIQKTAYNNKTAIQRKRSEFGIGTTNICLLPEYLSRRNNLSNVNFRTKEIGERIVIDQLFYGQNQGDDLDEVFSRTKSTLSGSVKAHFPSVDFLCVQEVWQSNFSDCLKQELHKIYPYIVCDVGHYSKHSNYFLLNSGLMFASKYEIMDVDFKYFPVSCNHCVYSSKGLLMIKVLLWYENVREDKAVVGYIYNTHLQAYQGKENIIPKQLDEIIKWTKQFRNTTRKKNDTVAFDIVCGDFNFDNMSPADKMAREHPIFTVYKDEGRIKPGTDQPWSVGTEMRQLRMYEEEISTPDKFKTILDNPSKRQQYVVDADIEEQSLDNLVYSQPKKKSSPIGGKRRIDYLLHNHHFPVVVHDYNFITRLTRLTDHIPVTMTFEISDNL